jgi:branched-subunit amino acid aminotransferase/4-amino-4-deoxychorismate lyase
VTALESERQRSSSGSAEPGAVDVAVAVAVAESWLVSDGRSRPWTRPALAALRARLFRCATSTERVAGSGRLRAPRLRALFPRIDAHSDGEVRLAMRPPDLARLGALRAEAARHGAGEALLCDGEGQLLEGASTSLLWWEGDLLWAVPDDAPILDGVTRRLLSTSPPRQGVDVRYRRPTPADLDGREVRLTSALQGIRSVTSSTARGCVRAGPSRRAPAWHALLESLAVPIGESAGR